MPTAVAPGNLANPGGGSGGVSVVPQSVLTGLFEIQTGAAASGRAAAMGAAVSAAGAQAVSVSSPFSHLIYPLPIEGGLGIHATNDLGGAARFGPDVTWVDEVDYAFDESKRVDFIEAIRQYFPSVNADLLVPAYAGVRSKLSGPGQPAADFAIHDQEMHGLPGLINLFGIDSPGLTSSLAIGEYVKSLLD